ncbi:MAG TPA: hypothetical protein VEK07_21635 [Polyangiaceae bacterium]|nr:hypothetical protein [Polyangiaceae bacterium]
MKLASFECRWAEAVLGAIFPGSPEEGLAGIGSMNVVVFLGDVMRSLPRRAALGMRLAIWLVSLSPLLLIGRLALFAGLTVADRERVLHRLATSRRYGLRSLVLLLKTIGALLYASDDRVRARMRGASTPLPVVRLRRLEVEGAHGA